MHTVLARCSRPALALLTALALSAGAFTALRPARAIAQEGQPAAAPAAQAPAPAAPTKPAGIPVPNLPIVEKKELEGGLIVEDMKIGDGYEIKPGDSLVLYYHGTFKSDPSKVFESAFDRGAPIGFSLTQMIPGWQQGVPGVKVGGIRRLTVPAALAYGTAGRPGIPPNADLVFVIQVIDALTITDDKVGEGEVATGGCFAVTAHTITDTDGKIIEKVDATHPGIWLPGEPPLSGGLEGMKVGGKRTIKIPKELNAPMQGLPTTRPTDVPLTIEVELLSIRPWPPR